MDAKLDPTQAFLGVGWAFPPEVAPDHSLEMAAYDDDIRQAIRIILGTNPGERVMRPDFGAGLDEFLFDPLNTSTLSRVQVRVRGALVDWEPRIDVLEVKVTRDDGEHNKLLIVVGYRVRATNSRQNFVYPFYLQEGTSE
jgi:phage baseplate assembly protein W